jgi:orotate phosphoribosyltransferase
MTKEELGKLIKEAAYLEGDFVLRSGKRSKYYLDKYLFETDPKILRAIGQLLAERVGAEVKRIAGAELGGVPLAAAASIASGKPFVIVRAAKKEYGTANRIEGKLEPGDAVLLVEDVVTTGGALLEAAEALTQAGAKIERIIAVIDREEGAAENIRNAGFGFESLFTKSEMGL